MGDAGQALVSHLLHSCHSQTIPVAPNLVSLNELSLEITRYSRVTLVTEVIEYIQ